MVPCYLAPRMGTVIRHMLLQADNPWRLEGTADGMSFPTARPPLTPREGAVIRHEHLQAILIAARGCYEGL
jgi:hypothetical protein